MLVPISEIFLTTLCSMNITDTDLRVSNWPLQWCELQKAESPFFVTNIACAPVRKTFSWNGVAFCACEVTQLCSVVSSLLRTVRTFDFSLVMRKIPNNFAEVRCILLSKGQYFLLAYKTKQLVDRYRKCGWHYCLHLQPSLRQQILPKLSYLSSKQ
jgi:hypothetical protein